MYKTNDMNGEFVFNVNKRAVNLLLEIGYDTMKHDDKNDLIMLLASENGLLLNEITPEYILDYHKKIKKDEMNTKCEEIIEAGFTAANGHIYRTNRDDQINMIGQNYELNADKTITTVPWKTEDVGYIDHIRDEWLAIYNEAFTHKKTQLFKYNSLKKSVKNAQTHDELIAIKWE